MVNPSGWRLGQNYAGQIATVAILICTAVTAGAFTTGSPPLEVWAAAILCSPAIAGCAVVDAHTHRIPTPFARIIAGAGFAVFTLAALITGEWAMLVRAVIAALAVGTVFFAKWWFTRGATGMGDVRLSFALTLFTGWMGWRAVLAAVVFAYLLVFPFAAYRLARRRRDAIPFGPALIAGWLIVLLVPATG